MDLTNFKIIKNETAAKNARLVIVSKTQSIEKIEAYYAAGHRIFGENRVSELEQKYSALPKDIEWHFIGHLQSKKVKDIAPFVQMIHAVDSEKLLLEIDKQAKKNNRSIDCLLQFHIAEETSKYGLDWAGAEQVMHTFLKENLQNVRICGVMGMATYTDNDEQIQAEFQQLVSYFNRLRNLFFREKTYFKEISMGMSGDYPLALQEGSTLIRVGSLLF